MEERLNIRTVRNLVQNGEYLYQRLPDGLVNDATTQALVSNDYAILNDLRGKELWKWVLSQPGIQIASYKVLVHIVFVLCS